jgi:tRNA dimethylallyltransferase
MASSDKANKPEERGTRRRALIVAGPTCSGKSALAMELARRLGGTVINADSMQVYRELPIVTARPTPADEAAVPHRLYGVRPAAEPGSVAWWRSEALAAMEASALPILCGGTGLYLRSLISGLADIPDPGEAARAEARALLAGEGAAALHARLHAVDAATAATLRLTDGQRIARAWEVWRGTGRGLAGWQQAATTPAEWDFAAILLDPPRADHAAPRRVSGGAGPARPAARPGRASHAGPWGAGTRGLPPRRNAAGRGRAARGDGERAIYQAPSDLVSPSATRRSKSYLEDQCSIHQF